MHAFTRAGALATSFAVTIALFTAVTPATAADHAQHTEKLGEVHFPTSCGADVQPRFDHAVALMHNFAFPVSNKAFSEIAASASRLRDGALGTRDRSARPIR